MGRIDDIKFWKEKVSGVERLKPAARHLTSRQALIHALGGDQICPICDGWGRVIDGVTERLCLCTLADERQQNMRLQAEFGLYPKHTTFGEWKLFGTPANKERQRVFFEAIKEFLASSTKWLLLSGPPGIGKTMLMHAMFWHLYPDAVYCSASELEAALHRWLSENTLEANLQVMKRVPYLLLDDLYSEYGADFVRQKMFAIIDSRYIHPNEFPTVISTNIGVAELRARAAQDRIASRLTDIGLVIIADGETMLSARNHLKRG